MKKRGTLDKFAVAAALQEIAALLEMKGGKDRFKARAYQTAARVISGMADDLADVIQAERLTSLRGIGDAIASHYSTAPDGRVVRTEGVAERFSTGRDRIGRRTRSLHQQDSYASRGTRHQFDRRAQGCC